MDKKTLFLMLGEAVLIVILVVVVAMDYTSKPSEETLVAHTTKMEEGSVDEKEAVAEEVAAKAEELTAKTPEEVVVEKDAEDQAVAQEEKSGEAEKPAETEKQVEDKAMATASPAEEKTEAPAQEKASAAAGSGEVADVIPMNNPAYPEHTKPIAQFTHKKHIEEFKVGCGDCHHDENAKPLTDLKMGDPVQNCIACHDKTGKAPKGEKLPKKEELKYHTEALHENCIGCHREFNQKNNTKTAPQTCGQCHVKES